MQEELSNFKTLLDHIGWKRLMEVAEGQLQTRMPSVLEKQESLLSITAKEFEKGEMAGINLFMRLPQVAVEGITADIQQLEEQIEHGYGTREPDGTDDGSAGTDGDIFVGTAPNV